MRNALAAGLTALALTLVAAPAARADILPPGSVVGGKTIGEWTQDWWRWAFSSPVPFDPLSDTTGANQNRNQPNGPVFFVSGGSGFGPPSTRRFSVPAGKYLLVPLVNWIYARTLGEDPADIKLFINEVVDNIDSLNFSLDGVPVPESELFLHREEGGFFDMTIVPGNVFGEPPGFYTDNYAEGYWVMLEPLSHGPHTLTFGGTGLFTFTARPSIPFTPPDTPIPYGPQTTAHINVLVPEPATALAFGLGALAAGYVWRRRRRRG
jgi:hypothetical protein